MYRLATPSPGGRARVGGARASLFSEQFRKARAESTSSDFKRAPYFKYRTPALLFAVSCFFNVIVLKKNQSIAVMFYFLLRNLKYLF